MKIGIVAPTFRRKRFLPRFIENVLRQSYPRWELFIIHDGPGSESRSCVAPFAEADERIHFLETEQAFHKFGIYPRLIALRSLGQLPQPPDYVVFWDDDNEFYPSALTTIVDALNAENLPDLLLISLDHGLSIRPDPQRAIGEFKGGDIDSAMLVTRLQPALQTYEKVFALKIPKAQDYWFFHFMRAEGKYRIVSPGSKSIGRYDGLRFFSALRWKLKIPPLNISLHPWYSNLRKILRG